jgi:glycosyltransferase involved in cell wall biosynthesis
MVPLRILSVANVPRDLSAGAAGAELETILALRAIGHQVDEVWSDSITRHLAHGNLHQLLELPRRYAAIVRRKLETSRYDVVHVNQPHGYLAARLVRKSWPGTVFIHKSHGFEPRVEEVLSHWRRIYDVDERTAWRRGAAALMRGLMERHNRLITRWADGHILCSQDDADYMVTRYAVDPRRAGVLPQAAPDAFLQPPLVPMTDERLRTILYVGQYVFTKAPMLVAAIMNRIAEENAEARFVWVAGPQHHVAIRSLLAATTLSRLELLGWRPQAELQAIYDRSGIFVFPSFFEGSGKVHIEALSRGLCVIATRTGGMRDIIQHGASGFLAETGNVEEFTAHALNLLRDPVLATRISAQAGSRAREFSWNRTAVETAEFYRSIIALNQQGRR